MKRSLVTITATLTSLFLAALPGSAGTSATPEITDPAGDANFASTVAGNQQDTRPASFDNADLAAVWFETTYSTTKILDPDTGQITRVVHRPEALVIHIRTQGPVRPLSPWGSVRVKVPATMPGCSATFELLVATNPVADSAEIRPTGLGACGELTIAKSPVRPAYNGAVSTITFPLAHEEVKKAISAGTSLAQISAGVFTSPPAGPPSPTPTDQTAGGRSFTIGEDVPPDIDCTADPANPECQP